MTSKAVELAERLREGADHIDTDGTPAQVGPDAETLRDAAAELLLADAVVEAARVVPQVTCAFPELHKAIRALDAHRAKETR